MCVCVRVRVHPFTLAFYWKEQVIGFFGLKYIVGSAIRL